MASDNNNEPAKLLLPYLQRADELQKHDPLVAYYCRLFAMEKGLKIPQSGRTKTTNSLLVSLINQLEKDKKSLALGPEDNLHLEGFALNVFAKADKQDRAGRADLSTAKTFYAASIFFEILNQFGALQPDLEQKQKYAVWKAADIRKAMKEGRKPTPGPPAGDDDLALSGGFDLESIETAAVDPRSEFDPSPQLHDHTVPNPRSDYDPSTQFHDQDNGQHSTNVPPSQKFHENANDQHSAPIQPPQYHDSVHSQHSTDVLPPSSTSSYPASGYQSHDFHPPAPPPPPTNRSEDSGYSQTYHHQSYSQDPQLHLPQNYPSHDTSSYHNFQSYPSFAESSLPAVPSHFPSYYQGSESSYSTQSSPPTTSYPSTPQYPSSSRNEANSFPVPSSTQTFQYDSNYLPPPEKIADAHKAARFAVGALAFDDVSVAVDFLKKSLELLTNPSAARSKFMMRNHMKVHQSLLMNKMHQQMDGLLPSH